MRFFKQYICHPEFISGSDLEGRSALLCRHAAFTLAEVLITLAIIGVVAAMTIPTLINTINAKYIEHQKTVIRSRFVEGLNLYNTLDNGLVRTDYGNTYEFLQGLSKHFKMSAICDNENLTDCLPYSEVNFKKADGTLGSIEVDKLKDKKELRLNDSYHDTAAFISGAGIPYVISLKKNCIVDPDIPMNKDTYSQCVAGFYDYSGAKTPNRFTEDLLAFGDAVLKEALCTYKVGGVCVANVLGKPSAQEAADAKSLCSDATTGTIAIDNQTYSISGVSKCPATTNNWSGDYWLAAKIKCAKLGLDLPTTDDLGKIANEIYGEDVGTYKNWGSNLKKQKVLNANTNYSVTIEDATGDYPWFLLWANSESSGIDNYAQAWYFRSNNTVLGISSRDYALPQVVCVAKP